MFPLPLLSLPMCGGMMMRRGKVKENERQRGKNVEIDRRNPIGHLRWWRLQWAETWDVADLLQESLPSVLRENHHRDRLLSAGLRSESDTVLSMIGALAAESWVEGPAWDVSPAPDVDWSDRSPVLPSMYPGFVLSEIRRAVSSVLTAAVVTVVWSRLALPRATKKSSKSAAFRELTFQTLIKTSTMEEKNEPNSKNKNKIDMGRALTLQWYRLPGVLVL